MTNELLQIKFKQRLNKLSSQDYDNIECWAVVEAFNNAQLKWVRKQIIGVNTLQTGDEGSKNLIDDLQSLLSRKEITTFTTATEFVETEVIPSDFLYLKKVEVIGSKDSCTNQTLVAYHIEEIDVANAYADENTKPNFDWRETFFSIAGNKIRVYKKDFTVNKVILTYYRKPAEIKIQNCVDPSTGTVSANNVLCEFKDDIAEILVDEAVSIMAADIESFNQYSVAKQNVQNNT